MGPAWVYCGEAMFHPGWGAALHAAAFRPRAALLALQQLGQPDALPAAPRAPAGSCAASAAGALPTSSRPRQHARGTLPLADLRAAGCQSPRPPRRCYP